MHHLDICEKNGSAVTIASACPPVDLQHLGELGWKHHLASAQFLHKKNIGREAILILTLTKNPYSWLLSLHNRPYAPINLRAGVRVVGKNGQSRRLWMQECLTRLATCFGRRMRLFLSHYPRWCMYKKLEFSDFIRTKWFTEFHEGRDEGFKNAIELWNIKNQAYLELAKHYDVMLLTYEELLASPEMILQKIAHRLGCPLKPFENIQSAAKKEDKTKNYQYYREYYLQEHWRKKLSQQDIQWISSQLDPAVMAAFGYSFLSP